MTNKPESTAKRWTPTKLRETPSWLLIQAANLSTRLTSAAYENINATHRQYVALAALGEMDTATQADLGRHCHMDRSDVTSTLSELESHGYVTRRENEVDRRQKLVSLTPAGYERLEVIAEALHGAQNQLLASMSHSERSHLAEALVGILDHHRVIPTDLR